MSPTEQPLPDSATGYVVTHTRAGVTRDIVGTATNPLTKAEAQQLASFHNAHLARDTKPGRYDVRPVSQDEAAQTRQVLVDTCGECQQTGRNRAWHDGPQWPAVEPADNTITPTVDNHDDTDGM